MIRKTFALLITAGLVALPALAEAGKARTATGNYNTIMITPEEGSPSAEGHYSNGVKFKLRPGERFVSLSIADEAGQTVRATVGQDYDNDGKTEHEHEFCGSTTEPIKLTPGAPVIVWAQEGQCADGTTSLATFGEVTATFTR
ncbi:MAG TPA: hypothetical protein VNP73_11065 [Actinomycetota bacterium]|nr:hypothetical protein [Actinomycetota bacterium]